MRVNAINNVNSGNIQFEGKKRKDIQPHTYSSSPLKTVPVVVLMAMSPVNAPVAGAKQLASANPQTEMTAYRNKVVDSEQYAKASPDDKIKCTINYISNDGIDDSVEKVQLVFSKEMNLYDKQNTLYQKAKISEVINMNTLLKRTIKTIQDDGSVTRRDIFFVSGDGTHLSVIKDLNGNVVSRKKDEKAKIQVQITEQFYNDLKSISDDSIKFREEIIVDDGETSFDDDLILLFNH